MTVVEHLTELRYRMMVSILAFVVCSVIAWFLYPRIVHVLTLPLRTELPALRRHGVKVPDQLNVSGVVTAFLVKFKVTIFGGIVLSMPIWLYQVWRFITPGLEQKEKRYAFPFVLSSLLLFAMGAVFAYIVLPPALGFLLGFAKGLAPLIFVDEYLKFVIFMILAFAITFELPLVLVFLGIARVIKSTQLRKYRRHAFVACFVIGAVATPSQDPYSMTLMAVPLYILYEAAVLVIRGIERGRKRAENTSEG